MAVIWGVVGSVMFVSPAGKDSGVCGACHNATHSTLLPILCNVLPVFDFLCK